jgi:hypothetical protein
MIDITQELPMPICEKWCVCLRVEGQRVRMGHGAMGTGMRACLLTRSCLN